MAFDGITISNIVYELREQLLDGRINKIAQPEADELLLTIKSKAGQKRLYISASASLPLIYLTEQNKPSPMNAPNFCMLLRKHINNGRITDITQPNMERIIRFEIEHLDELGDLCKKYLVVEIMGKHSNIIFCNAENRIIDSIKHVSAQMSSVREVLPGRDYFIPEKAPKNSGTRCLVDCPKEIREKCVYDAQCMYLDNCQIPQYPWQCTGKNHEDVTEEEKIESLKTYNPHGECIYKAGGDIVDHQNVMITFKNGSTAVHTLNLGSMRPGRSIWVQGTEGEIEGWVNDDYVMLRKYDRKTSRYLEEKVGIDNEPGVVDAHFGGDKGLVQEFCNMMLGKEASISRTTIDDSINGHLTCYLADESMQENVVKRLADVL